ncbi:uncharacterized protein LOC126991498 [Eriocheir sinensis]|uniref:uncharacterized protein LOC126991498 n=1 Tax=Eriocheir sinensis TaxID=95602 RepID=UPI0021C5A4E4|nr:uncharacterized protein LOC126991498 [Eriocheir sinensis]
MSLYIHDLPHKPTSSIVAATHFLKMDRSLYHHHLKIFTDGSHSPFPPSTASAIYDPSTSTCRTWTLPPETDVLTAELYALHQALAYLHTTHARGKSAIYTDSLSSLHLLLSRHPTSSTALAHTIQRALLLLTSEGWEVTLQWVPSHSGIRGNSIADAAAKMALAEVNITPLPLPLSTAKCLIFRTCRASWDDTLANTLRTTSMGQYRTNSSPQPWVRKKSRVLDVALTRLRLGHTRLGAHLHRLRLVPDPHYPCAGPSRTPLSTCCCTAHATTPSECCSDTNSAPWTCPPLTCPRCWRRQASTHHDRKLSPASPAPSLGRRGS